MKPGTNGRRPRGRPNRKQHGGQSRPNNFDSSGPEGRVRGNAHQVYERYLAMARDAISAGEGIAAETYYQYAEHYFRVLNSSTDPQQNGQARQDRRGGDGRRDDNRHNGGRQDHARREDNRHEGARQDGQRMNEAQNANQPAVPVATPVAPSAAPSTNGQDAQPQPAPPQPAPPENRAGPRRRRTAPKAPVTESSKSNGAEPKPENADARPKPGTDGGDCEPVSV